MDDLNIQETIMPSPQKKVLPLKLIIGIAIGVCGVAGLVVGGLFAYQNFFLSPEAILLRMIQKEKEIKTFRSELEIRSELKGVSQMISGFSGGLLGLPPTQEKEEEEKPTVFIIKSVGAFDGTKDQLSPESSVSFNLAVDETGKQPELEGKNTPQQTILLGAEMRIKDKVGYLALKKTPNLGFINFSALENQWVKFDTQTDESKKQIDELTKQVEEFFPKEKRKEFEDAFLKKKPFKIKKGNEKISGVSTHHLIIEVGRTEAKALLELVNSIVPEDKKSSDEELKKMEESLAEIIPADKPFQFNIWVGKRDFYPYQFRFGFDFPKLPDTPVSGNISIHMAIKDINKPVSIEVPKDVKKIEEVFGTLLGGAPSSELQDSDSDGLSDVDEIYYGSDSDNPDTDGDSYKDGEEIQRGYSPTGPGKLTLPPPPSRSSSYFESEQGESRDSKRIVDMKSMQVNLEIFSETSGGYPTNTKQKTIDNLWLCNGDKVNAFRDEASCSLENRLFKMSNPTPGGTPYKYVGQADGYGYKMNFTLEKDQSGSHMKGCNIATENGIQQKKSGDPDC